MPEKVRESNLYLPDHGLSIHAGSGMFSAYDDKRCWLSFTHFVDAKDCNYLYITSHQGDSNASLQRGFPFYKSIMLEKDFFSERHFEFMNSAFGRLPIHQTLLLSVSQNIEYELMVDKIESINSCQYKFKKEYLQQLIFLLIHFSIKNFDKSAALQSSSGTPGKVSKQICDNYIYSLN